jgi:hypothetical protein
MKIERATQLLITFAIASIPLQASADNALAEQRQSGLLRGADRGLQVIVLPTSSPTVAVSDTGTTVPDTVAPIPSEAPAPDPEVPDPEVPDPEVPDPEVPDPEVPAPEVPAPDPEAPDPEAPTPEVPDPEVPAPGPEAPDPGPDTGTVIVINEPQPQPEQPQTSPLHVRNRNFIKSNVVRPTYLWGRKPADGQTQNP